MTDGIYENDAFVSATNSLHGSSRLQFQEEGDSSNNDVYANQSIVDATTNASLAKSNNTPTSSMTSLTGQHSSLSSQQQHLIPSKSNLQKQDHQFSTNNNNPPPSIDHMSLQQQQLPQLLHWSEVIYECTEVPLEEWVIGGGSDYGQMPYLLDTGDILLELDSIPLAGLTRSDVLDLLRAGETHVMKAVSNTSSFGLPIDLREYLSRRFVRGSIDHDLQETIRENVYLRTIPCTTRPPKAGELDNVDYKFVTRDEFLMMEKSGILLESGIYSGHYYGTPLPLSNPATPTSPSDFNGRFQGISLQDNLNNNPIHQNGHQEEPKSPVHLTMAQKRKRNRSNIAAIDAASLPHGWEKISDAHYGVYYIDHINKRTQYERPYEIELTKGSNGFGFTLIELDRGLVVVKNVIPGGPAYSCGVIQAGDVLVSVSGESVNGLLHSDIAQLFSNFTVGDRVKLTFARGYQLPPDAQSNPPEEVEFDFFSVVLEKGTSGFGFTIADGKSGQKVRKVLDPERCGSLRQGDILCAVNHIDLTPLVHNQVVDILKNCPLGQTATITVKRKKRFRSKTPVSMYNSNSYDANTEVTNNVKPRSKTPSVEVMSQLARRDEEQDSWRNNHSNYQTTDGLNNNSQQQHHRAVNPPSVNNQIIGNGDQVGENINPSSADTKDNPTIPVSYVNGNGFPGNDQQTGLPHSQSTTYFDAINGDMDQSVMPPDEDEYEYHRVELTKTAAGFGFRIVGGSEEGRNVAVGSVVIGGVAYANGVLKSGDDIMSINDISVIGASHRDVIDLVTNCGPTASILIRRRKDADSIEVFLTRDDNEGFGFVLISCGFACLIGKIIPNSPTDKCGRLRLKDRIIAVNDVDIREYSHADIVKMITESGQTLKLRVIPSDCYSVELTRGPRGFGFSIRGGAEFDGMKLFILKIAPDGPAYTLLSVGDEIIEINGESTLGMTHSEAVNMISQCVSQVRLKLRKNYPNPGSVPSTPGINPPHVTFPQFPPVNGMPHSATYSHFPVNNGYATHERYVQANSYSNNNGMLHPFSTPNLNQHHNKNMALNPHAMNGSINNNPYPVYP
jgi:C-terminal processing protease CtpA/Prc